MTMLKKIEAARNDAIKAMTLNDVEAAAIAIMNGSVLPKCAAEATKAFVAKMNSDCAAFNQLMVEFHLRRMEIADAHSAALDYFDAIA